MTRGVVVAALGTAQTLAWGSSYYLPAILADPIATGLGLSRTAVFGIFSGALLVSAFLGPAVGRAIDQRGGRDVLAISNLVLAAGLVLLGTAQGVVTLSIAWAVLGVGMAMGLYEPAFATLTGLYGRAARGPITGITLIAGFASTVGWPLSAFLEARYGWRGACLIWAGLHIVIGLPLNRLLIPRAPPPQRSKLDGEAPPAPRWAMPILAYVFAVTAFVTGAMAAHLPHLLEVAGASATMAIAASALVGPAQVAARLVEFGALRLVHPLVSARLSTVLHPLGAAALAVFGPGAVIVFSVLHGAGNGLLTIARGTVPLAVFGPVGYPSHRYTRRSRQGDTSARADPFRRVDGSVRDGIHRHHGRPLLIGFSCLVHVEGARRESPGDGVTSEKHLKIRPGTPAYIRAIVVAQMLAQIGAFALPALLPAYMDRWHLSATEAGWLVGVFFAAYVVAVPLLLSLTDRMPVKRIYLLGTGLTTLSHLGFALVADGFWIGLILRAVGGIGWAGTYMTGLKALADNLEGTAQSRAVSWHAAGVGISGAGSFAIAGATAPFGGVEAAFLLASVTAASAFILAALIMPRRPPAETPNRGALLDYRPVFRNRAAMAWIAGYTVHTWEIAAVRAWGVTFFATVIAWHGSQWWLPDPTVLFTVAGLAGVLVSVTGNETAQRWGRRQVVIIAMTIAAALSLIAGWTAAISTPLAVIVLVLWNAAIYLDSSALTAGTVQAADPKLRGATMGLHSMCGYAGGFVGPPLAGLVLDLVGPDSVAGWGLAFGHLAIITLSGFAILLWLSTPKQVPANAVSAD